MKDEGGNWEELNAPHEGEIDAFSSLSSCPKGARPSSLDAESVNVEAFDRTQPSKKRVRRVARPEKTLREYVEEFSEQNRLERGLSRQQPAPFVRDLLQYVAWLEAKGVSAPRAISSDLVRQFAHDLRAGQLRSTRDAKIYAPTTIAAKFLAIRAWHRFLAREYRVSDPTTRVTELHQAPMREATARLRAGFKKAHPRA